MSKSKKNEEEEREVPDFLKGTPNALVNLYGDDIGSASSVAAASLLDDDVGEDEKIPKPLTEDELHAAIKYYFNVDIPRHACGLPGHVPPMKVVSDVFFARHPRALIHGCIPSESLVTTENGPRRMDEILAGTKVLGWDKDKNELKWGVVKDKWSTGVKEVWKIRTRRGELRATANHKILVYRKSPNPTTGQGGYKRVGWFPRWIRMDEVTVDDHIVQPFDYADKEETFLEVAGYPLTEKFAELLGLFLGDGFYNERGVSIAHHPEAEYMAVYNEIVKEVFDKEFSLYAQNYTSTLNSTEIRNVFQEIDLGAGAHNKKVPNLIWNSSKKIRLSFLKGYLDSDGTIRKSGDVCWYSCSPRLLNEIRQLALSCGLGVGRVNRRPMAGKVKVNGRYAQRGDMWDLAAYNAADIIGTYDPKYEWKGSVTRKRSHTNKWCAPAHYETPGGVRTSKVLSIEKEEERQLVWDMEVEGTHSFVCDTFIVSNSRGFSGKTLTLSTIGMAVSLFEGAAVTLLGGSGEQSARVLQYTKGYETNLPESFLASENFPTYMLKGDLTKRRLFFKNGGNFDALMASDKSVRGPHPNVLLCDELDSVDPVLWDAALGQPMESRGIQDRILASSTWQNPRGCMSREIQLSKEMGFPYYRWCWRCVLDTNGGWLSEAAVERKKSVIPKQMWEVEYDLAEPAFENRAFDIAAVENMFRPDMGEYTGVLGDTVIVENPDLGGDSEAAYSVGADWGKSRDKTWIVVLRTDVLPVRIVAYAHLGRIPFPDQVDKFNQLTKMYDAYAVHDATGIGAVIHDYLEVYSEPFYLVGKKRNKLFSDFIAGVEREEIVSPMIDTLYSDMKYATVEDFYSPSGHPPDSVVATALAFEASNSIELFI